jgi:hypothetical protein
VDVCCKGWKKGILTNSKAILYKVLLEFVVVVILGARNWLGGNKKSIKRVVVVKYYKRVKVSFHKDYQGDHTQEVLVFCGAVGEQGGVFIVEESLFLLMPLLDDDGAAAIVGGSDLLRMCCCCLAVVVLSYLGASLKATAAFNPAAIII